MISLKEGGRAHQCRHTRDWNRMVAAPFGEVGYEFIKLVLPSAMPVTQELGYALWMSYHSGTIFFTG